MQVWLGLALVLGMSQKLGRASDSNLRWTVESASRALSTSSGDIWRRLRHIEQEAQSACALGYSDRSIIRPWEQHDH